MPAAASRVARSKAIAAVTPAPKAKKSAVATPDRLKAKPVARAARAAPRVKLAPPQIEQLVQAAVASLEDDKAEDVVVLDIASRAAFADRMIVATGLAERQITAMAAHLEKILASYGIKRPRIETSPDWVLIDAGDLVLHLFKPEARANYRLEKMWGPDSPAAEGAMPATDDLPADTGSDADFSEAGFPSLEEGDWEEDEEEEELHDDDVVDDADRQG